MAKPDVLSHFTSQGAKSELSTKTARAALSKIFCLRFIGEISTTEIQSPALDLSTVFCEAEVIQRILAENDSRDTIPA
jgi:uncharacterized protein YaiL (DUF2058 family)